MSSDDLFFDGSKEFLISTRIVTTSTFGAVFLRHSSRYEPQLCVGRKAQVVGYMGEVVIKAF